MDIEERIALAREQTLLALSDIRKRAWVRCDAGCAKCGGLGHYRVDSPGSVNKMETCNGPDEPRFTIAEMRLVLAELDAR